MRREASNGQSRRTAPVLQAKQDCIAPQVPPFSMNVDYFQRFPNSATTWPRRSMSAVAQDLGGPGFDVVRAVHPGQQRRKTSYSHLCNRCWVILLIRSCAQEPYRVTLLLLRNPIKGSRQMKNLIAVLMGLSLAGQVAAIPISVDVRAKENSSTGGVGVNLFALTLGQVFSVSTSLTDLWNAGALPRWSNANGLVGNLFATGSDDSGELAGTLIGQNFGLHSQAGLSLPFGSLVGQIGGIFQLLGASFTGPAWATGNLTLHYWDVNNGDNTELVRVTADSSPTSNIPEPGSVALLGAGIVLLGNRRRQRKI